MKTRALDKCIRYIQKKINAGVWKPNESLPSIIDISTDAGVSRPTTRKALLKLERDKLIDNQGSLGFILRSNKVISLREKSITRYYLSELSNSMQALTLLRDGGKQIGSYVIQFNPITKLVFFVNQSEGNKKVVGLDELLNCINNPISLESVLLSPRPSFDEKKKSWERQQELLGIAKTVSKNKKLLGIN